MRAEIDPDLALRLQESLQDPYAGRAEPVCDDCHVSLGIESELFGHQPGCVARGAHMHPPGVPASQCFWRRE